MISLCHENGITFNVDQHKKNEISGGINTIRSIIGDAIHKPNVIKQLRNRSIMFLDQISTQDGCMLNNWKVITKKSFNRGYAAKASPYWYKLIRTLTTLNNNGRNILKPQYQSPSLHMNGSIVLPINLQNRSHEFIAIWNNPAQIPILGQITSKTLIQNSITVEH